MATEFKLKGLTSIDLKNGQTQEVEVEGVEDGKVLLAKVQDEIHALSAKCTHYGAPLSKGVLTGDGRLTCPWHGACFSVKTGDIEDAPAIDPLAKFEIVQKDGAVYIKGDEATIKANRRTLNIKCGSTKGSEQVVVVGRGSGATGAIEGLRSGGFTGKITCIADEEHMAIDRTKLSKALMNDASKVALRSPEFYKEGNVDMVNGTVTSIDFDGKKVKSKDGKEYSYTKLILASGGTPRLLPLEGLKGDLKNVFPLRFISDVQSILGAAGEDGGKKVVVIGSSFIGMEVGNALAGKKHQVSIIGMEDEPMERVMGKKVGKIFRELLEKNGVKFYMGASVEKGEAGSTAGKIGSVSLKDGTKLEADLVVEGVGVRPATDYLKDNSSVNLEKDGSISVDESFAIKGLKDVFAIGDIATYPYHGPGGNGKPVRIEHWNVAQNAGRSVARSINSPGSKPKAFIPVFWSAVGAQLRYCGHTPDGFDDVIIQGNTDTSEGKQSFVAYYTKGEEVHAVASMAKDPYMTQSAELMRRGRMPSKSELAKGIDIMEISPPVEVKMPFGLVPQSMLEAIFYARFHPERGPSVIHQYPAGSIISPPDASSRPFINWADISSYIIPPYDLCNQSLSICTAGHRVLAFPISLEDAEYDRNRFTFNICFVLPEEEDAHPWESIVRKTARFLMAIETEDCVLQIEEDLKGLKLAGEAGYPADVGSIYTLLERIWEDLNAYGETCIQVNSSQTLNLRLEFQRSAPPKVNTWDVPLLIRSLPSREEWTWDLTLQRIHMYIDGIRHVQKIAELADVEVKLVKRAVKELVLHGRAMVLDIFHFQAIYTCTRDLSAFVQDLDLQDECRRYVTIPQEQEVLDTNDRHSISDASRPGPTREILVELYSSLHRGIQLADFCLTHQDELAHIDIRRFITFGVIKGFVQRLHKYALALEPLPGSTPAPASGKRLSGGSHSKPRSGDDAMRECDRAYRKAALTSGWMTPPNGPPPSSMGRSYKSTEKSRSEEDELLRFYLDGCHPMDQICAEMHVSEKKVLERLRSGRFGEVLFLNK
ncbi:unnamed protein product [Zymoseptoria tritici ST99CH_1E4]|uniref:Rieske domain-containing protein n=1 Tax=Zymoseptoria tritici ST99CH_1E4 TaxID=1276532 RepID=A0A2H1GAW3_ZYMTR|nr:unnamed protein product [Zymoseptoria tritici ST99CH_1E4]